MKIDDLISRISEASGVDGDLISIMNNTGDITNVVAVGTLVIINLTVDGDGEILELEA